MMARSKLEVYLDILRVLRYRGPLKLTHVMYKANVNCNVVKENLHFLIEQGLVEEKPSSKTAVVYAITQRGIQVIKRFLELEQMLPEVYESEHRMPIPY